MSGRFRLLAVTKFRFYPRFRKRQRLSTGLTIPAIVGAAGESENLAGRTHLYPPSEDMPQVVYHGGQTGEEELLDALSDGTVDAVARGEIGNRRASSVANNGFVVTALDEASELGGFTLDVKDSALASCLSERIDYSASV